MQNFFICLRKNSWISVRHFVFYIIRGTHFVFLDTDILKLVDESVAFTFLVRSQFNYLRENGYSSFVVIPGKMTVEQIRRDILRFKFVV